MAATLQHVCEENLGEVKLKKKQEQALLSFLERQVLVKALCTKAVLLQNVLSMLLRQP